MTVHIPQTKQEQLFTQYLRLQAKVAGAAEKEHRAQLKRRRNVVDAFGKWLDVAPRAEVLPFLERLSSAATAADRKRIEDFVAHQPTEEPAANNAPSTETSASPKRSGDTATSGGEGN